MRLTNCKKCGRPLPSQFGAGRPRQFCDPCQNYKSKKYGLSHQAIRRRLLPLAYGNPCGKCGLPMVKGQSLDLDHSTPLRDDPTAKGDRIIHTGCNRAWNKRRQGPRLNTTERGYGAAHQKLRNEWKPRVERGEVPCARCGQLIEPGARWNLGHTDDRTGWTGPEHPLCNQRASAKVAVQWTRKQLAWNSRVW